jgi:HAD superfamily hydrolase (TIGR01549 family)
VSITEELVTMYEEAILFDPPILKKNVKKVLQKIDGKFKIGMISVTGVSPGKHVREILEDYKIKDFFDVFVFSDEVGYVKPSPVLFTKALNMLNVESNQCVHIGDSLNGDIKGAKNVGMKTVWIKTENKNYTKINPDYIITDLSELPKILDNF